MKKGNIVSRIKCIFFAIFMVITISVPVFAQNPEVVDTTTKSCSEITPLLNDNWSAAVGPLNSGESGHEFAYLDSYIGLTKKFTVELMIPADVSSFTGNVQLYVERVSDDETIFSCTLNNTKREESKTFWLPKSGDYKVVVYNNSNIRLGVLGYWS